MPYDKTVWDETVGVTPARLNNMEQGIEDAHASLVPYAAATGAANVYAVTLDPAPAAFVEGMALAVKINAANTGASTINVNGLGAKSILKANGNAVASGNLKVNSIYTLRYNGTAFILQGEGGSGNATAADLLSGRTATSDTGDLTGTMPNRGAPTLQPGSAISSGYYAGGSVASCPSQPGPTGNAVAADVLSGKTFQSASAGSSATGSMANRGAGGTVTPSTVNQTKAAGYYSSAITILGDPDLLGSNILSGKNIFNVAGALVPGRVYAEGTTNTGGGFSWSVRALSFQPRLVIAWNIEGGNLWLYSDKSNIAGTNRWVISFEGATDFQVSNTPGAIGTAYADGFDFATANIQGQSRNVQWIAVGAPAA